MASSHGTQPSKMIKREGTLTFNKAYRSLPEHTRKYTELTKKEKPDGKPVLGQFLAVFYTAKLHTFTF
jgi:hypothetical protein